MRLSELVRMTRACLVVGFAIWAALFGLFCAIGLVTGYLKWG